MLYIPTSRVHRQRRYIAVGSCGRGTGRAFAGSTLLDLVLAQASALRDMPNERAQQVVRVGVGCFLLNSKGQFVTGVRKGSHGSGAFDPPLRALPNAKAADLFYMA